MIEHYNSQVDMFEAAHPMVAGMTMKARAELAAAFVDRDAQKFSWEGGNFADVARGDRLADTDRMVTTAMYRPFHRRWANAGPRVNTRTYQLPRIYPSADAENLAIAVSTIGARSPFSALMTRDLPDVHLWVDDTPCFPQFVYETQQDADVASPELFDTPAPAATDGRRHNITDGALSTYRALDSSIEKDDLFFYVYGILHSPDYRTAFAADLKKSLPRIPQVGSQRTFGRSRRTGGTSPPCTLSTSRSSRGLTSRTHTPLASTPNTRTPIGCSR